MSQENTASIFEAASRVKLRFATPTGTLNVEDLWDVPLTSQRYVDLDEIAVGLHNQLKNEEVSFVSEKSTANTKLQLAFDIVKHIIDVKKSEAAEAATAADKKLQKQKLLGVLARKQDAALEQSSEADIKAMIEAL